MSVGKKTTADTGVQFEQPQTEEARHVRVGLDKTGAIHHFAEHESRVIVIKGGGIQLIQELADPPERDPDMAAWIEHVEDLRGWEECNYMTQTEFFEKGTAMGFHRLSEKLEARR